MKKVKVTDLNSFFDKELKIDKMGLEVRGDIGIIFNEETGTAILTDKEAIHSLHPLDEEISFNLYEKNQPDKNGVTKIAIMPKARASSTMQELMDGATSEMALSDYITEFGQRIRENHKTLLKTIKEVGLNPDDFKKGDIPA